MIFSPDQERAHAALVEALDRGDRVMCLTGPAGSGKTTLVKEIATAAASSGRLVQYAAPTGKAALRLREVTGTEATTLHGLLYGEVGEGVGGELVFGGPKHALSEDSFLIVDEASMVNDELHAELMTQLPDGAVLLYVGDREQLQPVKGTWGPDFSQPTAALTEIHRQAADNPIIAISAAIRSRGGRLPQGAVGDAYHRGPAPIDDIASWMSRGLRRGVDGVVLSWTHRIRKAVNRLVRHQLGFAGAPLVVGDRVKVAYNNKRIGRYNGEILTVLCVGGRGPAGSVEVTLEGCEQRQTVAYVHPELIGADLRDYREHVENAGVDRDQWLHIDYGYALTVHWSQGSEFEAVAFVIDSTTTWLAKKDPEQARRLVYTAVTRARSTLRVFDVAGAA